MFTTKTITEQQIRVLRSEAVEACDVLMIAACDAALDWDTFDPNEYCEPGKKMPFRSHAQAMQVCVDALNYVVNQS